jgi:single-stranded-DNA-specific exonuclease
VTWRLRDPDPAKTERLRRDLSLHEATARALVTRGIDTPELASQYLRPRLADLRHPDTIAGFPETVRRLREAVRTRQRIGVFGDYDVDGVTTTALLTSFLRSIDADARPRVASRERGYGFGVADAQWFAAEGCRLIVTCDCGTSDLEAIAAARAEGIDVIVIDHHQVPSLAEHPAVALLNPHRADSTHAFRGYASVGLGFLVAAGLRTSLKEVGWFAERAIPDVRELLDLVAVGTIADMAPLREENRTLVSIGLVALRGRRRAGFAALLARAEVEPDRPVDEVDVGWRIGPRLNAPGRLGDAAPSLELLLSDGARAHELAGQLEDANVKRRGLQDRIFAEALADAERQKDESAIVVARDGWHAGVVGIVAAKLVDRFRRPAAVIALEGGQGRGSVRTAGGVDVYRALSACREHLVRYGGHAAAAGLTVDEPRVSDLRREFAAAAAIYGAAPAEHVLELDAIVGDVTEDLAAELQSMAPFGQGNPAPVVAARGVRVREARRVGGDGAHLKLQLEVGRRPLGAISFRHAGVDPDIDASVDVAFCPEISQFRGVKRVELKVHALKPHEP